MRIGQYLFAFLASAVGLCASSLQTTATTSAGYCDLVGCGINAPHPPSVATYIGLYNHVAIHSLSASSNCSFGCADTSAVANANFGSTTVQAIANISSGVDTPDPSASGEADATASWSDKVRFLRSGLFTFSFDYVVAESHMSNNYANFDSGGGATVTEDGFVIYQASKVGVVTVQQSFSAGDVISLSGALSTGVRIDAPFLQPGGLGTIDRFVELLVFLDPDAQPFAQALGASGTSAQAQEDVSGPYYTTESGFSYLTPPAPSIPEPSTPSLIFGGTSVIIIMRTLRQLVAARKCQENVDAQAETEPA